MGVENPGTQRRSEKIALRYVPGHMISIGLSTIVARSWPESILAITITYFT